MDAAAPFESPQPVKLTVDDFALLHEAGAFDAYPRAELIDGMVVCMSPQRRSHTLAANRLARRLQRALEAMGAPMEALTTPTVEMPPHDAPEPDIAIVRDAPGSRYFALEALALAVEVSLTSLRYDLTTKCALYAQAGVPEYWVIDVDGMIVHQFWLPRDGAYSHERRVPFAGELRSLTMPDLAIDGVGVL